MSEKFEKLRFRVAKTGRAKYISHLDVVRCVQRAIRRSGLPVHYTNGFHPHMEAVFVMFHVKHCTWETNCIRFGKAGAHPQLALGIAIAPEIMALITTFQFLRQLRFFSILS